MDLTVYDIIQGSVISDKAKKLLDKHGQLVLHVHTKANKPMIKKAIEKLFNVKVESVHVIVHKGKTRVFKRVKSTGTLTKKAIIKFKSGYSGAVMEKAAEGSSQAPSTGAGS